MSFNLTEQPWIPVVSKDFQLKEVSLIELFETWNVYKEIRGDNPPTTLAIYRLLLAILHRAYDGPRNEEHWEKIDQDNGEKAIVYLQNHRDCFDFLHPERPFMQDPILPIDKAVPVYAIHTMSTSMVFSHEHESSGYRISLPETARLLVRLQGVDITSLRAFYVGQTQGNRSAVNTPSINTINVWIQCTTLKDSLLYNLVRYDPSADEPSPVTGQDLPSWETSYAGKPIQTVPKGYISYLTFPWRRLRVFVENEVVSQIAITMGNSLKTSAKQWECFIPYQDDKPLRFSPGRQLWRDADSLILFADKNQSSIKSCRPRTLDWLSQLEGLADDVVHLQVFGLGADKAKPLAWVMERLSVPRQYIFHKNKGLSDALKRAIDSAETHQNVFRSFRGSPYGVLAEVLKYGDAGKLAKTLDGESRYWATLDRAFPELLFDLPNDHETGADGIQVYGNKRLVTWTNTIQKAATDAFTESIASIRNYEARAASLRSLSYHLAVLRGDIDPKAKRTSKGKKAA
jgi:CRISPR system Cascade subunit CasA